MSLQTTWIRGQCDIIEASVFEAGDAHEEQDITKLHAALFDVARAIAKIRDIARELDEHEKRNATEATTQ